MIINKEAVCTGFYSIYSLTKVCLISLRPNATAGRVTKAILEEA